MSHVAAPSSRRFARRRIGKPQRRISAILRGLAASRREDMTVGDISTAFDARVFGAFFILFGGINAVPLPPGTTLLSGVPLVLVALQLAIGRQRLWLPERFRRLRLSPEMLAKVMKKIGPPLRRAERLARHRYWPDMDRPVVIAVGWFALVLAILVLSPIAGANMFPSIAIALLGVAITARDGFWLAAGVFVGLASIICLVIFYAAAVLALLTFV